jgi:hypothetical protein
MAAALLLQAMELLFLYAIVSPAFFQEADAQILRKCGISLWFGFHDVVIPGRPGYDLF